MMCVACLSVIAQQCSSDGFREDRGIFLYCRSGLSPTASTSASRPISSSSGATLPSQGCTGNALSLMKCSVWRAWLSGTGKPSSSCRGLTSLKCSVLSKSPSVLCSYLKILKLESLHMYINNSVKRNFHLLCHSMLDLRHTESLCSVLSFETGSYYNVVVSLDSICKPSWPFHLEVCLPLTPPLSPSAVCPTVPVHSWRHMYSCCLHFPHTLPRRRVM